MDRFRDVLLEVWREACQHIEICESGGAIARKLASHLPLASLWVRRFDAAHRTIETVASGAAKSQPDDATTPTICSPADWKRLMAWARSGRVLHSAKQANRSDLTVLAPEDHAAELLAGPLMGPDGPAAAPLLGATAGHKFERIHVRMAELLVDPFAAALENDRRLHELAALREAAEADRRSLLNRLGRQEMSDAVVGADSGLRLVMERVELVAKLDVPVLILGDTGSGKEVAARAIHGRSARSAGPFIRVNCGAIPSELIDSHLFGHEKGSFTGAVDQRHGWFERADGGTLFLDEIGELPLPAQVRLLRVLQDHQVERVGGQQLIHVDVRIVAATHRDLAAMVKEGTFREDLWYRINVFPILLPPLRDRTEDIPALARHFAQRAANRFGLTYVEPADAELELLRKYPWPGNIRELAAVIDRAAILGNGKLLDVATALGPGVSGGGASAHAGGRSDSWHVATTTGSRDGLVAQSVTTIESAMRTHIERALAETRGRIEGARGAASLLNINPHTLRARMRKLGIDWSKYR